MDKEAFFQRAAQALKENATYSQHDGSWTIGVAQVREIIDDLLQDKPEQILPSYTLILEEGIQRGVWKVNYDHEYVADLVVLRELAGKDHKG